MGTRNDIYWFLESFKWWRLEFILDSRKLQKELGWYRICKYIWSSEKNPQPAMGKRVGEIMIDFAFIRKYPIVNYNGYSSKA